jgi:hypothetical protein
MGSVSTRQKDVCTFSGVIDLSVGHACMEGDLNFSMLYSPIPNRKLFQES